MRIFITGSDGQLGCELTEVLKGEDLLPGKEPEQDITDEKIMVQICDFRPEVVIHAAAYTDVDGCEKNRDLAHKVNAIGTHHVARAAEKSGAKMVYISTDYVFSGRKRSPYVESDSPHPLNVYGQSKWEGEQFVEQACSRYLVLRTSWLYGRVGKNFVKTILNKATQGEELRVVNDQVGCPTYAKDLAMAIAALIKKEAFGLYHAAGQGTCSWFEFAEEAIKLSGISKKVAPIGSKNLNRPARRPRYSALNPQKLNGLGIYLRPWRDALQECIITEMGSGHGHERTSLATES
jgi:dTDP-4-dehydrorhamnose reductase